MYFMLFYSHAKKKSIYCIDVKNLYLSDTEKTGEGVING